MNRNASMNEITENLRDINIALGDTAQRQLTTESNASIGKNMTINSVVLRKEQARDFDTARGEKGLKKNSMESIQSIDKQHSSKRLLIPTVNEVNRDPGMPSVRLSPVHQMSSRSRNESPYTSRRASLRSQSFESFTQTHRNSIRGDGFPDLKTQNSNETLKLTTTKSKVILATSQKRMVEVKRAQIPNFEVRIVRRLNDSASEKLLNLNGMEPSLGISKDIFMSEHEKKAYEKMRQEIRDMIEAKPIREIKILKWETLHIAKGDVMFTKLAIRKKKFPLVIRIEFLNDKTGVFDAYVSKRFTKPSAEKNDFRYNAPTFDINYSEDVKIEWLYMSIEAVTSLDFSILAFFSEGKQNQEQVTDDKEEKIDWQELHQKNMKWIQEKNSQRFRKEYTEDELTELKAEVGNALSSARRLSSKDWIKQKRRHHILSLARGHKDIIKENIIVVKSYREKAATQLRAQSADRERRIVRAQSAKQLAIEDKQAQKIFAIQKKELQRQINEEIARINAEIKARNKIHGQWINFVAFNILIEGFKRRLWEAKYVRMFNKGRHRAASRIQEAFRKFVKRNQQNPQQRLILQVRSMLNAFCKITQNNKVPLAIKIVTKTLKNECFRAYCFRRIVKLYKSAILFQRFWRRFAPVLHARIKILEKFLKKIYDQVSAQASPRTSITNTKGNRKKKKQATSVELLEDDENKKVLAKQLLDLFKRLEADQNVKSKLLRSYLRAKALDHADEIRQSNLKAQEKKKERRLEIEKTRVRIQQIEERKVEEEMKRVARPSLKYAAVLNASSEKEQASKTAIKKSKQHAMAKIHAMKAIQSSKNEQPGKYSGFLIFKKDELLEFLEEKLKEIDQAVKMRGISQNVL